VYTTSSSIRNTDRATLAPTALSHISRLRRSILPPTALDRLLPANSEFPNGKEQRTDTHTRFYKIAQL